MLSSMKTQFSRTRRTRNTLLGPGSGPVLIGVIALIIVLFVLRTFFPGTVAFLARPFWSAGSSAAGVTGSAEAVFGDKAALARERDVLAQKVVTLEAENMALTAQANDLARLLGGRTEVTAGVVAGVLARPPVSPYDTLVIDKGSREGVSVGHMVYGAGGLPIGSIETVANATSRVLLYSAPGRVTEGWVGEERTPVALEGASAGAFRTSVPRESTVTVGALVYVPGGGALPVGTVVRVDSDPSTPRAVIHVKPVTNPFSITAVTVGP